MHVGVRLIDSQRQQVKRAAAPARTRAFFTAIARSRPTAVDPSSSQARRRRGPGPHRADEVGLRLLQVERARQQDLRIGVAALLLGTALAARARKSARSASRCASSRACRSCTEAPARAAGEPPAPALLDERELAFHLVDEGAMCVQPVVVRAPLELGAGGEGVGADVADPGHAAYAHDELAEVVEVVAGGAAVVVRRLRRAAADGAIGVPQVGVAPAARAAKGPMAAARSSGAARAAARAEKEVLHFVRSRRRGSFARRAVSRRACGVAPATRSSELLETMDGAALGAAHRDATRSFLET